MHWPSWNLPNRLLITSLGAYTCLRVALLCSPRVGDAALSPPSCGAGSEHGDMLVSEFDLCHTYCAHWPSPFLDCFAASFHGSHSLSHFIVLYASALLLCPRRLASLPLVALCKHHHKLD